MRLVSVHVVHLYSSIDTIAAWKKLRFILSVRSDLHMTDRLLVAVHAFVSRVLMSFLVDVTLRNTDIYIYIYIYMCVCVCVCVCVLKSLLTIYIYIYSL